MHTNRLNSGPSGSNGTEKVPEFAVVIARHALTDNERQRMLLLDQRTPARIISRFSQYVQKFVFNARLTALKEAPAANSVVYSRYINTGTHTGHYYEIFFVFNDMSLHQASFYWMLPDILTALIDYSSY